MIAEERFELVVSPAEEISTSMEHPSDENREALHAEDALTLVAGKLSGLEKFLASATKNSTFTEFSKEILSAVMDVVKCEAGSFLEIDHQNQNLFFRAVVGTSADRVVNFVIPLGQGIAGHVAESRTPFVVDDASENKIHLKTVANAVGFETRNLVAVTVLVRGRIFGVIELLNRVGERSFLPSDIELLTYLADIASRFIEIRLMIGWVRAQQTRGEAA